MNRVIIINKILMIINDFVLSLFSKNDPITKHHLIFKKPF
jgi:hypothetical protein